VGDWLRRAPSLRGVLVRGIRFPDATVICDFDARDFPVAMLEQAYRCVAETFSTPPPGASKPTRLVWMFERAALHCARRADGTVLGAFVLPSITATDLAGLDLQLASFDALAPL
jgi:hypothetical protein